MSNMIEISTIKITDIKPAEYNPRMMSENEYTKLRNSMETFGIVDPIIINLKNNHIIGGHQRYEVLLSKSMEDNEFLQELHLIKLGDVGWAFTETELEVKDEDHEKALNLALNKIAGDWDLPKLESLFNEIILDGFNTELTGFDTEELNNMFNFDDVDSLFGEEFNLDEDMDYIDDDYAFDEVEEKTHTYYLIEGDTWKFGNHEFKVGEVSENDKFLIRLDFDDMRLTFKKIKGDENDPFEEFMKANEKCKGLNSKTGE